ncbi:MAG: SdrD B-like domain-containing protein [candidate division KSB1 bacterium]|nr:SdrD B-like domain-containing protein [candidate division KSB1 bacterium]
MNKYINIIIFTVLVFAASAWSQITTQTVEDSTGWMTTDWTESVVLDQFDSSLGRLVSAKLVINVASLQTVKVENLEDREATVTVKGILNVDATLPEGGTPVELQSVATAGEQFYQAWDGSTDYAGGSGRIDEDLVGSSQFNQDRYEKTYTGTDLAQFIGTGTVSVDGNTDAYYNVSGTTGKVSAEVIADANMGVQIVYTYSREADLELSKQLDVSSPEIGDTLTFTLTVNNNGGPLAVDGVVVSDQLPANLSFISSDGDGSYNETTGDWTVGDLAIDESKQIQIKTEVTASGNTENTAEITAASLPDPDSEVNNDNPAEDDQDAVSFDVPPQADLSLEKTVNQTTPNVRDEIEYTLTVTNDGPDAAENIIVTDQLPTGLSFVSDNSGGDYDESTGEWEVGNLNVGESQSIVIRARVTRSGTINNSAEITATDTDDPDSTPNNNLPGEDDQDNVEINVPNAADLSLQKTTSVDSIRAGEEFDFLITITNDGPDAANNVEVTDVLDSRLTLVSSSATQGSYNSSTDIWTVGTVANGATGTLTLTVSADDEYDLPIENTAEVSASDEYDPDSTPGNGDPDEDDQDDSNITSVKYADLQLTKAVDEATPYLGSQVTFTLTLENSGPDPAFNVVVNDVLPAGLSFDSSTPSQGSYNQSTGDWSVGDIAVGTTHTLTITATVDEPDEITNTAQVSSAEPLDPDSEPGNDDPDEDDQDQVTLDPVSIDLDLSKSANQSQYFSNDTVVYTLTLVNNGRKTANNIEITDAIPAGLTVDRVTPSAGNWSAPIWSLDSLNSGATETLSIRAVPNTVGDFDNTAEVTAADEPDVDSTPNNNAPDEDDQDTADITVRELVDLSLQKSVDNASPAVGGQVVFTLTVSNAGPDNATQVVVKDVLPDGLSFVSASPADYDAATHQWTVGSVAGGAQAGIDITARVDRAGVFENTAEVSAQDQEDADSTPDNGDPAEDDQDSAELQAGEADLSLTKSVSADSVMQGVEFDFVVTITNNGPDDVSEVNVTDVLPSGLTLVTGSPDYDENTGVWSVGELADAESKILTLVVQADAAGEYSNTAQVTLSAVRDPDSTPDNNDADEDDQDTADVQVYAPGSIGDYVWADYDGAGDQDAGEPGIENVRVLLLSAAGDTLAETITNSSGGYLFSDLDRGDYSVAIDASTVPANYNLTTTEPLAVNLSPEENYRSADFGYQPEPSSIGDLVWGDLNNNQLFDSENGLSGIELELSQDGSVIATQTTDSNGNYLFETLMPGTFTVNVVESTLPADWELTTANEPLTVNLGAGEDYRDADFGYRPRRAEIGDYVWQDINGDGVQDSNEPGVETVRLILFDDQDQPLDSALTDADGAYLFDDLPPGSFTVRLDTSSIPAQHSPSTPTQVSYELTAGESYPHADFGLFPARVSIGDYVFFDYDQNGTETIGSRREYGFEHVRLILLDSDDTALDSMFSGPDGRYLFTDLPYGDYSVRVDTSTAPDYHTLTSPMLISASLEPGDHYSLADFGFYRYLNAIGDFVYHDQNMDGVHDPNEPPIPGVIIRLLDENGTYIAKQVTGQNGKYLFERLAPKNYQVEIDMSSVPENYQLTTGSAIIDVELQDNDYHYHYDFGLSFDLRTRYPGIGKERKVFAWYEPWYGNAENDSTLRHWAIDYNGGIADTSYWGLFDSHRQRQWEYDILQAWNVGIDAFVVEWHPQDTLYSENYETAGLMGLFG